MPIYDKDNKLIKRAGVLKRQGVFIVAGLFVALMSTGGYLYAVEKTTNYLVENLVHLK